MEQIVVKIKGNLIKIKKVKPTKKVKSKFEFYLPSTITGKEFRRLRDKKVSDEQMEILFKIYEEINQDPEVGFRTDKYFHYRKTDFFKAYRSLNDNVLILEGIKIQKVQVD